MANSTLTTSPPSARLSRRLRLLASHSVINFSLAFWAVLVILPLIWLVYSSFKTDQEIFFEPWAPPGSLQWNNFERAWVAAYIGQYFVNSLKVVIPSLVLTLALSSMTAYILARFRFLGNRALFYLFMAGMLFPIFLALVPLFFLAKELQLLNSFFGLTLVYTAYSLPFTIFFLTGFFKTLPSELHEAALIDGANEYQVFFRVMLPLAQPGLVAMAIFNFLGMWNQYILPLVLLSERENYVLPQGLSFLLHQQYYKSDWSALFAALTIIMAPTLAVYVVFQSQIQKGVTVGALKG